MVSDETEVAPRKPPTATLQVSSELLQKYLNLEKNFFLKVFLRFAGMAPSCPA